MFSADMENHTPLPTAAERYASIRDRICARLEAEGARYSVARMVDLLLVELLTWMIGWCVNRDEQRLLEQACQDEVVAEPELAGGIVAIGGDERRAVVRKIASAADPVAADEDCPACERRHPVANLATIGRGVFALDDLCRVFAILFAKTELRNGCTCVDFVAI